MILSTYIYASGGANPKAVVHYYCDGAWWKSEATCLVMAVWTKLNVSVPDNMLACQIIVSDAEDIYMGDVVWKKTEGEK